MPGKNSKLIELKYSGITFYFEGYDYTPAVRGFQNTASGDPGEPSEPAQFNSYDIRMSDSPGAKDVTEVLRQSVVDALYDLAIKEMEAA